MTVKDYYRILGCRTDASQQEVRQAYRRRSMQVHPDRNPGRDMEEEMKEVNEAWYVLGDAGRRAQYDAARRAAHAPAADDASADTRRSAHAASGPGTADAGQADSFSTDSDTLRDLIGQARAEADRAVRDFYANLRSDARKAARASWDEMSGWLLGVLIVTLIGLAVRALMLA